MRANTIVLALTVISVCQAVTPTVNFAWKQVDFVWDSPEQREQAISEKQYVPENNVPLGLIRWKNKMFVTIFRWYKGVVSSLNYIDLDGPIDQPLKPYPSLKDNLVPDLATELPSNNSIISVFRLFIDPCDRLWVMDNGLADLFGSRNRIARPSLAIFDLNTDQLLHRYFLKPSVVKEGSLFGNMIVDMDKDSCDDAFAYISDIGAFGLVVYSLKQDDSWRVAHHYFHIDPLAGTYRVKDLEFHWTDGVFGLALSEPREDGYRSLFFHPFTSTKEFYVSTGLLRNYTQYNAMKVYHDFKLLGDRGEMTHASSSAYDEKSHVLFYTQVNREGVGCWNSRKPFTPENNPLIVCDSELLEFPVDLKLDEEGTIWVLSDRIPRYFYQSLDPNEINFRILSFNAQEAIEGTTCE